MSPRAVSTAAMTMGSPVSPLGSLSNSPFNTMEEPPPKKHSITPEKIAQRFAQTGGKLNQSQSASYAQSMQQNGYLNNGDIFNTTPPKVEKPVLQNGGPKYVILSLKKNKKWHDSIHLNRQTFKHKKSHNTLKIR